MDVLRLSTPRDNETAFQQLKGNTSTPRPFYMRLTPAPGFFPSIFTRASMSSHGRWHVITCWQISVTFRSRYSEIWSNDMVLSHETTGEVLNSRNIRSCINLSAPQRTSFLHGVRYKYLCGNYCCGRFVLYHEGRYLLRLSTKRATRT